MVDSFVFLFSFAKYKLYETGHCFAKFRSFRKTRKKRKYKKKGFELFRKTEKNRFVSYFGIFSYKFCTISSNCVHFIRVSYLLFKFRTFYSWFVTFFELCRYLIRVSYLLKNSVAITTCIGRLTRFA